MVSSPFRGKRVCIACSEPGAAQVVLLLYPRLKKMGAEVIVVARGAGKNISQCLRIPIEKKRMAYFNKQSIKNYIAKQKFDAIIVGTSLEDDLERNYIKFGKSFGLPTIAMVDWWINYKERFVHSKTKELCLPDQVCVNDKGAQQAARRFLGKKVKIVIMGNPYFTHVLKYQKRSQKDARLLLRAMRLNLKLPTILFIAEPCEPPYINQFEIFEAIASEIKRVAGTQGACYNLIIKFHPSEHGSGIHQRYQEIVQRQLSKICNVRLVNFSDLHTLITAADYVWGMNSAPLLEAMARGKLVSSFLPRVKYLGIPFQKKAGWCPSANAYVQFPKLIKNLLTNREFITKALIRQRRYKLPKENFVQKVVNILADIIN